MMSKGIAFVTGAARGIGKAIALRLADDGFDVAVNDLPESSKPLLEVVEEIKAKGRASSSHLADVSVEEEVKAMFAEVVQVHGGLDVMVSNAGIVRWATLSDMSVEDWDRIMAVNCRGMFLCYRYAGLQMVEQGRGGRIIGAGSVAGKRVGSPFMSAYAVSKFAIRGLTQAAAMEFGPHSITVNSYCPGPVYTDMLEFLDASSAEAVGAAPGTFIELTKDWGPLHTTGTTTDVANLVSFIASEESRFITGQSLSINGGMFFD
ncbi:acetoin reductase family protein [Mycena albidolilacea]|uniref:Acetoin reductase family protein n=1 Tax=Mycena albidolilacea TaxID=1033008 RepID=A0AAD6Z9J5_9AGAR|nr:acetoin reductase family protein [Mycena albidolilacea]